MIVVADTNVILRVIVTLDAPQQTEAAIALFEQADEIVIPPTALCEAVWVLHSAYGRDRASIATSLRELLAMPTVVTDWDTALAGLYMLDAGGDFADGAIQSTGEKLASGASVFATFDRKAARLLTARSIATVTPEHLPTPPRASAPTEGEDAG